MSWIKIEHSTPDKPEVFRIAMDLGITPEHVTGCLVRLWIWADLQTINGNSICVTGVTLDRIACNDGFAKSLQKVGWLVGNDECFSFPNFDRHNGETAKNRSMTRKRVEKHRNAKSVTVALPREEKRREDIKTNTMSSSQANCDDVQVVKLANGKQKFRDSAIGILEFLNLRAGRHYRATESNLSLIAERLNEGATEQDCRTVIVRKCNDWREGEMSAYLRPATLFNKTKFAQYVGEFPAEEKS